MKTLNKITTLININIHNKPLVETLVAMREHVLNQKTEEARAKLFYTSIKNIAPIYKNSSIIF
jgi:hypothetical protein